MAPSRDRCDAVPAAGGLDVVILGSGGPGATGRAGSSTLVTVDGQPRVLVDVGPGTFVRFGELGLSAERLDVVLLTHLHVDHAGDLAAMVKARDVASDTPLAFRIFGPAGAGRYPSTRAFVDRLFGADGTFAYLPSFRNALDFVVTDVAVDLEAPPALLFERDGLRVRAVAVDHDDVPAVAYRVDYQGRSVVVTGDLASKRGRLSELARGADLLVFDTAVLDPPGSPAKLYDLHTPPQRIGEVAASAGVQSLVLAHVTPAVEAHPTEVLASVRRRFAGDVRFASDCLRAMPAPQAAR